MEKLERPAQKEQAELLYYGLNDMGDSVMFTFSFNRRIAREEFISMRDAVGSRIGWFITQGLQGKQWRAVDGNDTVPLHSMLQSTPDETTWAITYKKLAPEGLKQPERSTQAAGDMPEEKNVNAPEYVGVTEYRVDDQGDSISFIFKFAKPVLEEDLRMMRGRTQQHMKLPNHQFALTEMRETLIKKGWLSHDGEEIIVPFEVDTMSQPPHKSWYVRFREIREEYEENTNEKPTLMN